MWNVGAVGLTSFLVRTGLVTIGAPLKLLNELGKEITRHFAVRPKMERRSVSRSPCMNGHLLGSDMTEAGDPRCSHDQIRVSSKSACVSLWGAMLRSGPRKAWTESAKRPAFAVSPRENYQRSGTGRVLPSTLVPN